MIWLDSPRASYLTSEMLELLNRFKIPGGDEISDSPFYLHGKNSG